MSEQSASVSSKVQDYDNRIHPMVALRAWRDLKTNKEDTGQVFRMIGALKGKSTEKAVVRMKKTKKGRRLLQEKPDLLEVLEDRERLRAMPEGSLGRAYLFFMESEGFTAQGLIDASAEGARAVNVDPDVAWVGNRLRDLHDLYHVATGYGRDPLGELCVVGLGNVQNYNRGIAFLVFMGRRNFVDRLPNLPIEECFQEARARGRKAVFLAAIDWEALLDKPLEGVRKELNLGRARVYNDTKRKLAVMEETQAAAESAIAA